MSDESSQSFSEEKKKMEGSKFLDQIEKLQTELKSHIQEIHNEIRNIVSGHSVQDELNNKLVAELHQITEMLQKLENAHQYTHRVVSQHEKNLEENRTLIHRIEEDIQKIKSLLRVD